MTTTEALVSPEEYLRREEMAKEKSEYLRGTILPMPGASTNHVSITPSLSFAIQKRLSDPCQYFDQDTKIFVAPSTAFFYADGGIARPARFVDDRAGAIDNPIVIFEVMSPSSALFDRRDKFTEYARLESLKECVMVASESANVQVFRREGPESWNLTIYSELSRTARLESVGLDLPLAEIYARVAFS